MRRPWLLVLIGVLPGVAVAQGGRDEEFYLPGRFNWMFQRTYPEAARLFNGFDYGHAILSERLAMAPDESVERLEVREFDFLVGNLLKRPPRFAVAEESIMPNYSRMAWRAKSMFERAHVLHRQIYDVYADERLSVEAQTALVERLTDHYLADTRYAFTDQPKAMELMDDQYYSQGFRKRFPKFNGLIWAYHWLQVGLYESLLTETGLQNKKASMEESVARFWAMTAKAPANFPSVMPMTVAVAPVFSERHQRAAVIFDNLHMLHDIISDILESPKVPKADRLRVINEALDEFQNPKTNLVPWEHGRMMAAHMGGVDKMGGVAGRRPSAEPYFPATPGVASGAIPSLIGRAAARHPLAKVTVSR